MRGISIKALIAANVAYFIILGLVLTAAIVATLVIALLTSEVPGSLPDGIAALKSSPPYVLLVAGVAMTVAALGAGAVAARIARHDPLLHGALAMSAATLLGFHELGIGPVLDESADTVSTRPIDIAFLFVGPLLAMLGGHLARRRQARLDAMTAQERATHTLKAAAVMTVRWLLAFPAAAAGYIGFVKLWVFVFGPLGITFVFAVVSAVLFGTLAAPPAHRRLAGFLFIVLVVVLPIEEVARHAVLGGLTHAKAYLVVFNVLGAGLSYQTLLRAFPQSFRVAAGPWWWLADSDYARWTPQERSARRALYGVGAAIWLALFLFMAGLLDGKGIDLHFALVIALLVTLPLALLAARPAFARMAPDTIRIADELAAARLADPTAAGTP